MSAIEREERKPHRGILVGCPVLGMVMSSISAMSSITMDDRLTEKRRSCEIIIKINGICGESCRFVPLMPLCVVIAAPELYRYCRRENLRQPPVLLVPPCASLPLNGSVIQNSAWQ